MEIVHAENQNQTAVEISQKHVLTGAVCCKTQDIVRNIPREYRKSTEKLLALRFGMCVYRSLGTAVLPIS